MRYSGGPLGGSWLTALTSDLGLKSIAEGVEELAQAEVLMALGCDEAQGYHFGHLEPADIFAKKWLRDL